MNAKLILSIAAGLVIGLAAAIAVFPEARQRLLPSSGSEVSGKALVGGPFTLVDDTGKRVTDKDYRGRYMLVFFGFTSCPDICPAGLQLISAALDKLGPKADRVTPIFISVDPERDTPAQLTTYLSNDAFPKGTIGLTGTPEQVAAAAKAYRTFYRKVGTGTDYLMDHPTPAYLMNPKGAFARVIPFGIGPDEVVTQISAAMRE